MTGKFQPAGATKADCRGIASQSESMTSVCPPFHVTLIGIACHMQAKAVSRLTQATEYPLVIFTLLESDDLENEANLRYYVREGIREDDGCTHIIIVDPDKV